MGKRFQLILTLVMLIILIISFLIIGKISLDFIHKEIVNQLIKDGYTINQQVILEIEKETEQGKTEEQIHQQLQKICNEIKLPNDGFICATKPGGEIIAGMGFKPGSKMSIGFFDLKNLNNDTTFKLRNLEPNRIFEGYAKHPTDRIDIIVSVPLKKFDIRIFVHQNNAQVKNRVELFIRPLLILGIIIILVISILCYYYIKKIVDWYENILTNHGKEIEDSIIKIAEQSEEILGQNQEIKLQKEHVKKLELIISQQKEELANNIIYGHRSQHAIFAEKSIVDSMIKENFILLKPKDIISGDFYWCNKFDNKLFVAVGDCTGHGVHGAFLVMLAISFLNEIVIEKKTIIPFKILNKLRRKFIHALKHTGKTGEVQDGMDISICVIDKEAKIIQYSGANSSIHLIRDNEIHTIKGDKVSISSIKSIEDQDFTNFEVDLVENDIIYMTTDGYSDQLGEKGKYKTQSLKELLLKNSKKPFDNQKLILDQEFESWKGTNPQTDDILIFGFKPSTIV